MRIGRQDKEELVQTGTLSMLALSVLRDRKLRAALSTSSETASSVSGSGCPVNVEDECAGRSGIVIDNVYRLA